MGSKWIRCLCCNVIIRISGHCLPKENFRKNGIGWDKRYCNLCDENKIGTEQHVMVDFNNKERVKIREQLKSNIINIINIIDSCAMLALYVSIKFLLLLIKVHYQYTQFSFRNMINIHLLANDTSTNYDFAIFLKKVFSSVKSTYTKRTSVPHCSDSNGGIKLVIIRLITLWSVADVFDDIQITVKPV